MGYSSKFVHVFDASVITCTAANDNDSKGNKLRIELLEITPVSRRTEAEIFASLLSGCVTAANDNGDGK